MKIASIETFVREPVGFTRVRTDTGDEGWGQLSPYCADITAEVLHRQVAPVALGAEALDVEALADRGVEATYKFPGSYVRRALTGIDTALWDLRGRLEGKPVCALVGGTPRPIPVYASSMRRDITPKDEAARLAQLQATRGYRAAKVRIGSVCGHDTDAWPGRTEALVPTVRHALADGTALFVDANSCYTAARAIEVGRVLQNEGVRMLEEPCPYWEIDWTRQVTAALEMDVSGGEQDCFLWQWRRIIETRAVDVVQPDVCYLGGLARTRRVAAWAEAAGLPCVPHAANRSMVMVFSLHLMAAIANAGPFLECSIEETPWTRDLFDPAIEVTDGCAAVPEGPGWGVTIRPAWLERAARRVSERA